MKFPYRAANSGEKDFFFPGLPLFGLLQLFSFGMDKLEFTIKFKKPLLYKTKSFHFVFFRDFSNDPAWITYGKTMWWNISCHNTASSNNSPFTDCYTSTNNHVSS